MFSERVTGGAAAGRMWPLELVDDEGNAAGDQFAWRVFLTNLKEFDGKGDVERPEDESCRKEISVAQRQVSSVTHRIQVGPVGAVGRSEL